MPLAYNQDWKSSVLYICLEKLLLDCVQYSRQEHLIISSLELWGPVSSSTAWYIFCFLSVAWFVMVQRCWNSCVLLPPLSVYILLLGQSGRYAAEGIFTVSLPEDAGADWQRQLSTHYCPIGKELSLIHLYNFIRICDWLLHAQCFSRSFLESV